MPATITPTFNPKPPTLESRQSAKVTNRIGRKGREILVIQQKPGEAPTASPAVRGDFFPL